MNQANLFDVNGHVALVTGAASGLGLAFAEVMAQNGALVVLADSDATGLDNATVRLRDAGCRVAQAPTGELDAGDLALFRRAIDVNLTATFLTIRFAAAHMKRQRGGSIIATTSIA